MPSSKTHNRKFKVLILAGGYGTRLYPLTLDIPKPLLKIGSKVVIDFAIDKLKSINIEKIFLLVKLYVRVMKLILKTNL